MKPTQVGTMVPNWVTDILPHDGRDSQIIKAACLVGTGLSDRVLIGQVSHMRATAVAFKIQTPKAAYALSDFARVCCLTVRASILRTAIMIGLELPRVGEGVMSCTRTEKLTEKEIYDLLEKAKSSFPHEL